MPGALDCTLPLRFSINLKYWTHFVLHLWDLYAAAALLIRNLTLIFTRCCKCFPGGKPCCNPGAGLRVSLHHSTRLHTRTVCTDAHSGHALAEWVAGLPFTPPAGAVADSLELEMCVGATRPFALPQLLGSPTSSASAPGLWGSWKRRNWNPREAFAVSVLRAMAGVFDHTFGSDSTEPMEGGSGCMAGARKRPSPSSLGAGPEM